MNEEIKTIQEKIMSALVKLDTTQEENLALEVAKSNAISQLANTYIKSCNLIIRVEETKQIIKRNLIKNEE